MTPATIDLLCRMARLSRTPRLRSMREFAESEIVIPTGPFAGRKFSCERNPFAELWFREVDQGGWRRNCATGPVQSGKTLQCSVIPTLYHLFEVQETVLFGLPSLDLVNDKWRNDLKPAIEASKYRDLLPKSGPGSKGGESPSIRFGNGVELRFMTGGGGDKSRASYTTRVLVVTEIDGMDEAGGGSREADKITQLEGRTSAFGDRARIYLECTVSVKKGRTWQEYTNGTRSRLVIRCVHCNGWVTPERKHLVGWQNAEDEITAGESARFACPDCGCLWTNEERLQANRQVRLIHRGQEIDAAGNVLGPRPRTTTLGFRWTCVNNSLKSQAVVAQEEWRAAHEPDERKAELAEKGLCQFAWAEPPKDRIDSNELDSAIIAARVRSEPRGIVPADAQRITVGVDVGKWMCHFVAIAWRQGCSPHVLDYGILDVHSDQMAVEHAILAALREFRDGLLKKGWGAEKRIAGFRLFDSGNWGETIKAFASESGAGHLATKGLGDGQDGRRKYHEQKTTGATVIGIGDHYHLAKLPDGKTICEIGVDHWKTWVHDRLKTPLDSPGAMTLFHAAPKEHTKMAKHLTAEQMNEDGNWEEVSRTNHYFDATVLACIAGHLIGERLIQTTRPLDSAPKPTPAMNHPGIRMPDGRPFLVTQR